MNRLNRVFWHIAVCFSGQRNSASEHDRMVMHEGAAEGFELTGFVAESAFKLLEIADFSATLTGPASVDSSDDSIIFFALEIDFGTKGPSTFETDAPSEAITTTLFLAIGETLPSFGILSETVLTHWHRANENQVIWWQTAIMDSAQGSLQSSTVLHRFGFFKGLSSM
jgi:hypothetical protein